MQAVVVSAPGAPPQCAEFPEPDPVEGQEVVELVGAGIHQIVRSRAAGTHYSAASQYPMVPGVDAVARTGAGRLIYTGWVRPPWGTMAEQMSAPIGAELPVGCDPLAVAAGMNPGLSGYLPLSVRLDQVGRLGTVVVLGATGVSGGLAVQSALALGASHVVALGRNAEALRRLAGARVSTARIEPDLDATAAALSAALGGTDPSIVLDYLWGPPAQAVFGVLMRGAVGDEDDADIAYVSIGSLAGGEAALPSALLRSRRIAVTGSGLGSVPIETLMQQIPKFMALIADGSIEVSYRAFPIAEASAAWAWSGPGRAVIVPDRVDT